MKLEDRLKSLGTGLAVISAAAILFSVDLKNNFWVTHVWLRYTFGTILCLLFLVLLAKDWVLEIYQEKVMKKRNLSNTVVSKKVSTIDILDAAGHKAVYFQKAHFSNIKDGNHVLDISADPAYEHSRLNVQQLQLANCSAQFSLSQKSLKLYFVDEIEKLNDSKSLYPVEKYFYFTVELIDCFTHQESDSWDITTLNYTKEYELNIHFPAGKKIDEINIYRRDGEEEFLIDAANPILISKSDRDSIYLLITNFDQNDKFVIRWSYTKTNGSGNQRLASFSTTT